LGLGTPEKRLPPPPPAPVTYWERTVKHVKGRPYLYSALGGATFTLVSTVIAVHVSPAFRAYLFGSMPFLKPIYLKQRRALPSTPRPRTSADGRQRLEIVLVLGCDQGSYGREVAKALERQGFIVIASVSRDSEVDELEIAGKGFINAIVLDENSVSIRARIIIISAQIYWLTGRFVADGFLPQGVLLYQVVEYCTVPSLPSTQSWRSFPIHYSEQPRRTASQCH